MARIPKLYAQDTDKFEKILRTFVKNGSARAGLLVDPDGRLLAEAGSFTGGDLTVFCAEMTAFWRQCEKVAQSLQLKDVGPQLVDLGKTRTFLFPGWRGTLLIAVFEESAAAGMVSLAAHQALPLVAELFEEIVDREAEGKRISKDFEDSGPSWPGTPLPA